METSSSELYLGSESFVERIFSKLRPYVIFTALNTVWRSMDMDISSILDLGCGKGEPMDFINRNKRFYTIGVDVFKPYLMACKRRKTHDDYILCDVTKSPLLKKSVDMVLCTEVLEHLGKEEGNDLLGFMEKVARKQIIITTPVGEYKQSAYDGNPYQIHQWVWGPSDLCLFGYKIKGAGVRGVGGENGLFSRFPRIHKLLSALLWVLMGPLTYFTPSLAGDVVCVKRVLR
jgi:SAM-dependent methyltransferase